MPARGMYDSAFKCENKRFWSGIYMFKYVIDVPVHPYWAMFLRTDAKTFKRLPCFRIKDFSVLHIFKNTNKDAKPEPVPKSADAI